MKKALFVAAAFGVAGTAMAELASVDRSNWTVFTASDITISAESLDSPPVQAGPGDIYNSIGPGTASYLAFPAASGSLGFDDYSNASAGPTDTLDEFGFVGGAGTPGNPTPFGGTTGGSAGTMFVTFFNSAGTSAITGFGVALPQPGNFIWTITLGTAGLTIPSNGIVQLFTYQQGQFFLTSPDAVTVGANSTTFGGASAGALVHAFRHHIPEPATVALVALGALALIPRRR